MQIEFSSCGHGPDIQSFFWLISWIKRCSSCLCKICHLSKAWCFPLPFFQTALDCHYLFLKNDVSGFPPPIIKDTIMLTWPKRLCIGNFVRSLEVVALLRWFVFRRIRYCQALNGPVNKWWKNMQGKLLFSQLFLVDLISGQACSNFMNLLFCCFCLQILFFTVQYCNQPHDSTDIYHAIHCCFPCLHIPGMSDLPAPQERSFLPLIHYL